MEEVGAFYRILVATSPYRNPVWNTKRHWAFPWQLVVFSCRDSRGDCCKRSRECLQCRAKKGKERMTTEREGERDTVHTHRVGPPCAPCLVERERERYIHKSVCVYIYIYVERGRQMARGRTRETKGFGVSIQTCCGVGRSKFHDFESGTQLTYRIRLMKSTGFDVGSVYV